MLKEIDFRLTGVSPLLMHNGHLANPTNPHVRKIKEVTKKRTKTDADYEALRELEWYGGLYVNGDERPVVPGEAIESMLQVAAKKEKNGVKFKAGVFCMKDAVVEYDGAKKVSALYKDGGFVDQRMVVVNRARILRTRPIFYSWSIVATVTYNPDLVNEREVISAMETAGSVIGVLDYRPKFGRFDAEFLGAVA